MYTVPFLILSAVVLSNKSCASRRATCKVIPKSSEWPIEGKWSIFNSTLGGNLLKPSAPAAACYPDQPEYNQSTCNIIRKSWNSTKWHSEHPTSSDWNNSNDYSCLPYGNTSCSTAGYPVYVINASTPELVRLGVDFARNNSLRLNIKSTGHDFLGR
jgi:hypothetical protein